MDWVECFILRLNKKKTKQVTYNEERKGSKIRGLEEWKKKENK